VRWAALVPAALVLGLVISAGLSAEPAALDPLHAAQQQAAAWVAAYEAEDPARADVTVAGAHVAFWLAFRPQWPTTSQPWWFDPAQLSPGSLLVWDSKYSPGRGMTPESLTAAGWRELTRFGEVDAGSAAIIYQREGT
jgi:hypothetical protein